MHMAFAFDRSQGLTVVKETRETSPEGAKKESVEVRSWMERFLPAEWCACIRAKVRLAMVKDFTLGLLVLVLILFVLQSRRMQ